MAKFKAGDRVLLPRVKKWGWDLEAATVLEQEDNGILLVEIFPRNLSAKEDPDGLRECSPKGVVLI